MSSQSACSTRAMVSVIQNGIYSYDKRAIATEDRMEEQRADKKQNKKEQKSYGINFNWMLLLFKCACLLHSCVRAQADSVVIDIVAICSWLFSVIYAHRCQLNIDRPALTPVVFQFNPGHVAHRYHPSAVCSYVIRHVFSSITCCVDEYLMVDWIRNDEW